MSTGEEKYYSVKVNVYTETESGKEKTEKIEMLVHATGTDDANHIANKHLAESSMLTFEIVGVSKTKIVEVI